MTSHDVLEFLQAHPDHHFNAYTLAKKFNVSTQTMNMTLAQLGDKIKDHTNGRKREYWFESEHVRVQKQEREAHMQAQLDKRKKVWKMPQSTVDALARAREGRSPDFGYVTIS